MEEPPENAEESEGVGESQEVDAGEVDCESLSTSVSIETSSTPR